MNLGWASRWRRVRAMAHQSGSSLPQISLKHSIGSTCTSANASWSAASKPGLAEVDHRPNRPPDRRCRAASRCVSATLSQGAGLRITGSIAGVLDRDVTYQLPQQ